MIRRSWIIGLRESFDRNYISFLLLNPPKTPQKK
jgi:hypothetical protein